MKPRQHLLQLAPYVLPDNTFPAGVTPLYLAQNESALGASPKALSAASNVLRQTNLYPDPNCTDLAAAIALQHRVDAKSILCGNGSLSLIALLCAAYLDPGDEVVTTTYSYLYFRTVAKQLQAKIQFAPEYDYRVDIEAILATVTSQTKMVFVANPGNPTGTLVPSADLVYLRNQLAPNIMLVIDEAYAEYAELAPLFDLVTRGNTVVLRTFSKIYGLAGMRVGWGSFPTEVIDILRRIQRPNTVTKVAQAAATAAMADQEHVDWVRNETASVRTWLTAELENLGIRPVPSNCNFVLCRFPSADDASHVTETLRNLGIVIRQMKGYGMPDCIRITLGTKAQMERFVNTLYKILK